MDYCDRTPTARKKRRLPWSSLLPLVVLGLGIHASPTLAQISSDNSVNTLVTPTTNRFTIEGGTTAGNNLFHSFSAFSVPTGSEAYFNNSNAISNIISRVTGGNVSNIEGILRTNGTANLFLINPAGITFSEQASLNLGGSFIGTTANSILFENDLIFSANETSTPPLLSVNTPIGLQFGESPAPIQVRGNGHNLTLDLDTFQPIRNNRPVGLQVKPGQTLALLGGDVLVSGGNLTANRGRIELGSVAQAGTIDLPTAIHGFTVDYGDIAHFGTLSLTEAASVDVSGEGSGHLHLQAGQLQVLAASTVISNVTGTEDGGNVIVRATDSVEVIGTETGEFPSAFFNDAELNSTGNTGLLSIEAGTLQVANNAFISSSIAGAGHGGGLTVSTHEIEVSNSTQVVLGYETGLLSQVLIGGTGQGGDLNIYTQQALFRDGVFVAVNTNDAGDAGDLNIHATTLEVVGENFDGTLLTLINADTNATGQGGDLVIETDHLSVRDGGQFAAGTFGEGNGGNFIIRANTIEVIGLSDDLFSSGLFVDTLSSGTGGNLVIETQRLSLRDGANIFSGTSDTGNGGNITVHASERIEIIGKNEAGNNFSILTSATDATVANVGHAGNVFLSTPHLLVADGGSISASTFSSGNGGNIEIQAHTIDIREAALDFSDSLNGIVTFVAPATFEFDGSIQPPATGDGGSITIQANQLSLANGGQIDASTFGDGTAGNINLDVNEITLSGRSEILEDGTRIPSRITSVSETDFAAGSINLNANTLEVRDSALIAVDAISGDAGNLSITTRQRLSLNQGKITATAARGNGGNLTFNVGETLQLRDNSEISTTAGRAGAGGDGGNIILNAPLIISFPGSNSDITANAFEGNGGNIKINTQGIFGTTFRSELTPESDITASSQFGVDGTVNIETPDVDPQQGLVPLPTALADVSNRISKSCDASANQNSLVAIGNGGLPINPTHPLQTRLIWQDQRLGPLEQAYAPKPSAVSQSTRQAKLTEALGWARDRQGQLQLVAQPSPGHQWRGMACLGGQGPKVSRRASQH